MNENVLPSSSTQLRNNTKLFSHPIKQSNTLQQAKLTSNSKQQYNENNEIAYPKSGSKQQQQLQQRRVLGDITNTKQTPAKQQSESKKRPRSTKSVSSQQSKLSKFSIYNDIPQQQKQQSIDYRQRVSFDEEPELTFKPAIVELPPVTYSHWSTEEEKYIDIHINVADHMDIPSLDLFKTRRSGIRELSLAPEEPLAIQLEPILCDNNQEQDSNRVNEALPMGLLISDLDWQGL
jgi:hypothetical protein